jgi:hypothetical protein
MQLDADPAQTPTRGLAFFGKKGAASHGRTDGLESQIRPEMPEML